MKVFYDGSNYVVANNATEAKEVYADEIGDDPENILSSFDECEDDEIISCYVDRDGEICSQMDDECAADPLDLTAAEWIDREAPKHNGNPFFLCSEDA